MSEPKHPSIHGQLATARASTPLQCAATALLSRRRFLGIGAAAVSGAALWSSPVWSSPVLSSPVLALNTSNTNLIKPKAKVGLQLYTVRDLMAQDVAQTLKLIAGVGYQELEFAGYFNHSPKALRAMLDSEGLTAPSCHLPLEAFDQGVPAIIEAALAMGHQYIVIPYLTEQQRGDSLGSYQKLAARFNQIGEALQQAGLKFAYHNHDFEFNTLQQQRPYDVLLAETDPRYVAMELDLYWIVKAKLDPLQYFAKHPGRFPLWHVKDIDNNGNFADVGKGTIDFKAIFAKASSAGLQHAFVERDDTDDKIRTISQGFQALRRLRS